MEKPISKRIAYAYPTSTHAKQFGFYKTGCWLVEAGIDESNTYPVVAFETWEEAHDYAETIPHPYNRYSMLEDGRPIIPFNQKGTES